MTKRFASAFGWTDVFSIRAALFLVVIASIGAAGVLLQRDGGFDVISGPATAMVWSFVAALLVGYRRPWFPLVPLAVVFVAGGGVGLLANVIGGQHIGVGNAAGSLWQSANPLLAGAAFGSLREPMAHLLRRRARRLESRAATVSS